MTASTAPTPRLLLTGPAGSGKTYRALERIRQAATTPGERGRGAGAPGETLLILPTYAEAMHRKRVALSRWNARAILDEPFATFTSAGERFLTDFRVRALPTAAERDGLMEEALRRSASEVFERVVDRPGFRAHLLRLVKEIKQSGLDAGEAAVRLAAAAPGLAEEVRERLDAFLVVFRGYEELLEQAGLEDHEDTLRRLRNQLVGAPPAKPPRWLVVDGFDDFTPVEQGILDALTDAVAGAGGEVLVTLPWDAERPLLFDASREARAHLLRTGFREETLAGFPRATDTSLAVLASELFLPERTPETVASDGSLRQIVAGDPEDQAEAIARAARALAEEEGLLRGWRDLGVVVRRLDGSGERLLAAFERLGVPARLVGGGGRLAAEALARAARGPLLILGGATEAGYFEASSLLPWMRWHARSQGDDAALAEVDRLEMGWRRAGFPATWKALLEAQGATWPVLQTLATEALGMGSLRGADAVWPALSEALERLLPLPLAGGLDAEGRPHDQDADAQRVRAAATRERLQGIAAELRGAMLRTGAGSDLRASKAVDALLDAAEATTFRLPDRRLDAVNVMDAEEARFWELPVVIVGDFEQGRWPLHPREDVILRDADRTALRGRDEGLGLPLAREREARERRLVYGALTRARKRLLIVRSACDANGEARAASLYLGEVERLVDLSLCTERRPAGRPAPTWAECHTTRDLALWAAANVRDPRATPAERRLAGALLAAGDPGLLARAARWRRTEADPIASGPWNARFASSVERTSATALRTALHCRHRFFLGRVVGVPEDDAPLAGPAYGPRERGTLVHEALRRALAESERSPDAIARSVVAEAAARDGAAVPDEIEIEVEVAEVARVVRLLRDRERRIASLMQPVPAGLELSFGGKEGLLLAQDGRALRLLGQVDRVDAHEGRAVVADYKLGAGSAKRSATASDEGLDVQLPLYALAVESELGLEVVAFEWIGALTRARHGVWASDAYELAGARDSEPAPPKTLGGDTFRVFLDDALRMALDEVEAIRAGDHVRQRVDPDRCGACAWRDVCRPRFSATLPPEDAS